MPDRNLFETSIDALAGDDHRMRAWLALVGCFTSVERSLRRRFAQEFNSSLPRYDVLTALSQSPGGLTMGQLAAMLMVSKGNITGVVRRLQESRFVRQSRSPDDRRVQLVTLTSRGRQTWLRMHSEYRSVIDDILADLSDDECAILSGNLGSAQGKIDEFLQREESAQ